jgi:hypothetical protein
MSGDLACSFSGKEVKIWFGQSEAMMAILDFASLQQITILLQNP